MHTGILSSKDGCKLFFRAFKAQNPLATILLLHGFSEHSGRYLPLAYVLSNAGFNVLAVDLRGHGYAQGKRGYIDVFEQYVDDAEAALRFAKTELPSQSFVVLGHSMGGMVALSLCARLGREISGLVLSGPLLAILMHVPQWKRIVGKMLSEVWPGLSMPADIKPADLTSDQELIKVYEKDPLVFYRATARWFVEVGRQKERAFEMVNKLPMPVLLQLAENERIVNNVLTKKWFAQLATTDKKMIEYPDMLHEIYNEIQRELPYKDLVLWLTDRFSMPAQAANMSVGA